MSNIIILKINKKICGIYNSENLVNIFIKTCLNCNFIKRNDYIELEFYHINSFILLSSKVINLLDNNQDIFKDFNTLNLLEESPDLSEESPDLSEESPDLSEESPDLSEESTDLSEESLDLSEESAELSEESLDLSEESLDLSEESAELSEESAELSEESPDLSEESSDGSSESDGSINATDYLNNIKKQRDDFNKIIEISQKKNELQSNINKLMLYKKRIDEKQNKYEYDLDLFKKFKILNNDNKNFKIPELFKNKFKLFLKLEKENNLNFESFNDNYQEETFKTSYFDLFENEEYAYKLPLCENFINDNIEEIKNL